MTITDQQVEREIPNHPGYKLRSDGYVWNPYKAEWITPSFDKSKGCRILEILKEGKKCRYQLHNLLALLFINKPEGAKYVSFRNGNSKDVTVENIYWGSSKKDLTPKLAECKVIKDAVYADLVTGNEIKSTILEDLQRYYPKLLKEVAKVELTTEAIDSLYERVKETIMLMKAHPKHNDTVRKILYKGAQRRAKEQGLAFNICCEDIFLPTCCPYLGEKLVYGQSISSKYSPSLDRIIPSKGYVVGNVQVISMLANNMKSHSDMDELITFAKNSLILHE